MEDDDEQVKRRAREIWEEEGRPEGREYSHWLRARLDVRDMNGSDRDRVIPADIAANVLPAGTVPENPTRENVARGTPAPAGKSTGAKKSLDERDIDTQLDDPL